MAANTPRRRRGGAHLAKHIRDEACDPDDLLLKAIADMEVSDLPGSGKPIDLDSYYASGAEDRIAFRLLRDNAILPTELELRKTAEQSVIAANSFPSSCDTALGKLRERAIASALELVKFFPTTEEFHATLALSEWPQIDPECRMPLPPLAQFLEIGQQMVFSADRYNRQVQAALARCRELSQQADRRLRLCSQAAGQHRPLDPLPSVELGSKTILQRPTRCCRSRLGRTLV